MKVTPYLQRTAIYLFLLTIFVQCGRESSELSPKIAALVGTWRLTAPDTTFKVTLIVGLDTANPPHDVTPLLANGQSAVNTYKLRLFATVDGTMSSESWSSTNIVGTPAATAFEQTYFQNLQAVVRYQMPAANQLYLYHGGSPPHVMTFEKIN